MLHPDFMIQIEHTRIQDLRNEATDRHLAKIAQGDTPNRLLRTVKGIVMFAKLMRSQLEEIKQISSKLQVSLRNKQA